MRECHGVLILKREENRDRGDCLVASGDYTGSTIAPFTIIAYVYQPTIQYKVNRQTKKEFLAIKKKLLFWSMLVQNTR